MASINVNKKRVGLTATEVTHEGGRAKRITPEQQLRRTVMACLLFEDQFYEEGNSIYDRIRDGVSKVDTEVASKIAVEAREQMKLRHAPLAIVREMARTNKHKHAVAQTLERVIQRPDELTEFLALYWSEIKAKDAGLNRTKWETVFKKTPIANQVKKGLARAFGKFDEYQLAKYNREGAVRLRDVLFLCHAKPQNPAQADLWKRLVDDCLKTPDTWEVAAGRKLYALIELKD